MIKIGGKINTFKKAVAAIMIASNLFFNAPAVAKNKPSFQKLSEAKGSKEPTQLGDSQSSLKNCKIMEPIRADNTPDSKKYDFVEQTLYITSLIHLRGFDKAKFLSNVLYFHYFDIKKEKQNGFPAAFAIFVPQGIWVGIILKNESFDNKPKPDYNVVQRLTTYVDGKCGPKKEEDGKINEVYVVNNNILVAVTTTGRLYRVKWSEETPFEDSKINCAPSKNIKEPDDVLCFDGNNIIVMSRDEINK